MKRLLCSVLIVLVLAGCGRMLGPENGSSSEGVAESVEEQEAADTPRILTLVVPEGYTVARIGMELQEMEFCTLDEFLAAVQREAYQEFPLIAALDDDERRCFRLEGYLFPATYEFYSTETPEQLIARMVQVTENKLSPELLEEITATGYTVDEILTMASIIEKESFGEGIMPQVSAVLHNRLSAGMKLQCDVTINYVEGAIKPFIQGDKNFYNEYYNTYKCAALPAGPICNPGMAAIVAAIWPEESEYLFFLTDENKKFYFSETFEGHQENERVAEQVSKEG